MKFIDMVWAAFLARVKPVSTIAKPGLHEHDEEAGDQRPDEVDGDLVVADRLHHFGSVGFAASLTVTSLAVPVAAPADR